ncbi:MAG: ABC transporter substrate-binding protein [Candidatus Paracaedibacteraceae bacterium]|nr:ABC transporter substrate-binding protein [Candidatus Paracaedibacteraceae bacterium]
MKKNLKIILISLSLALITSFLFLKKLHQGATDGSNVYLPIVCISQITEHPALDEERRGIIAALESAGYRDGETVKISYQNAQGNVATAAQIAKSQAGQKPAVMIAIATSSAQALLPVATSQKIPMVFTAVTNPIDAKLVKSNDDISQQIYGISDALPTVTQIQLIRDFLPTLKTIGVIYNGGEVNSTHMVKELKTLCEKESIIIIEAIASKTSDVVSAAQNLTGRVEAIYIPNDNTAVSAMSSITQVAEKAGLPVFAGDTGSVQKGALATRGYDRFELGQKAGAIAVKLLKGEKPIKNVDDTHNLHVYVNEKTRKSLGITIPEALLKNVIMIGTDA